MLVEAAPPVQDHASSTDRPVARRIASRLTRWRMLHSTINAARDSRTALIDRLLNIHTTGYRESPTGATFADSIYYGANDYLLLRKLIKPLRLAPDDVVFEVGCGMGRTVCAFARKNIKKCVGIEIDQTLAAITAENARTLRGRKALIEIHAVDAALADYTQGTIFWFNNPFGAQTMAAVMRAIELSLQAHPRSIQVAYIHPLQEHVLAACPWLRCVHRAHPILYTSAEASYWTNDGRVPKEV